jgi:hypothetical protein
LSNGDTNQNGTKRVKFNMVEDTDVLKRELDKLNPNKNVKPIDKPIKGLLKTRNSTVTPVEMTKKNVNGQNHQLEITKSQKRKLTLDLDPENDEDSDEDISKHIYSDSEEGEEEEGEEEEGEEEDDDDDEIIDDFGTGLLEGNIYSLFIM